MKDIEKQAIEYIKSLSGNNTMAQILAGFAEKYHQEQMKSQRLLSDKETDDIMTEYYQGGSYMKQIPTVPYNTL